MATSYRNFIDGAFSDTAIADRFEIVNPATEEVIGEAPDTPADEVDRAVQAAKAAQPGWEKLPPQTRAGYLRQISTFWRILADI